MVKPSCHFGSRLSCFCTTCGMSQGVVLWSEGEAREASVIPVLTLLLGTTFLLGLLLGWCIRGSVSQQRTSLGGRWERLVRKAIYFVGRRRRVSLAFNAYKDHRLRTGVDRDARPKRRSATPGLLHEGFAIRNGPNRRRAPADQHPGGGL